MASADWLSEPISSASSSSSGSTRWSDWTRLSCRALGFTVCSANSRRATTGFLSRSRSIVSSAPPEISRARRAARRTRSKRLGILSTLSSTVTRAMGNAEEQPIIELSGKRATEAGPSPESRFRLRQPPLEGAMADSDPHLPPFRDPPPFSAEAQGLSLRFYPGGHDRLEALIGLIERARKQLKLCFYIFATDESAARVRDALTAAAERGVDVRLIVDSFGAVADERFFAPVITAGGSYACFMGRWSRRYLIRNHQKMVIADGRV